MNNKNILIVILALLVACMGGYLVYDKILDKTEIDSENSNNNVNEQQENVYNAFFGGLKNNFSKFDTNNHVYQKVESSVISDGYAVTLDEHMDLYVEYFDSELNSKYGKYKISNNVLSFYVIATGQGGGNILYFINEDGTVGSADTEYGISKDSNKITVNNDLGYKNIVTIMSGVFGDGNSGIHGPIFIDINGNIYGNNLK